jgi:hypothetical protein
LARIELRRRILSDEVTRGVLAGVALAAFGVWVASAVGAPPTVTGGTAQERSVLLAALQRLKTDGVSARISSNKPAWAQKEIGPGLSFAGRADPESQWKEEIAAGVYAAHGLKLNWFEFRAPRFVKYAGPVYPIRRKLAPIPARRLVAAIRYAAMQARVRLEGVELLKPMGYAPVVTIRVLKPQAFQRRGGIRLPYNQVEGFFVIYRNGSGRVYARGGSAPRMGMGAGSIPGSVHG